MELEEAKSRLKSIYTLIENLSDDQNIGKGLPSRILMDQDRIVMAKPQALSYEPSPLLEEFMGKYEELWEKFIKEGFSESEARQLVSLENELWDKHFG